MSLPLDLFLYWTCYHQLQKCILNYNVQRRSSRLRNWLLLWCLVPQINLLPPVCWKSSFKQQLVCKCDIAENVFHSFWFCLYLYVNVSWYIVISHLPYFHISKSALLLQSTLELFVHIRSLVSFYLNKFRNANTFCPKSPLIWGYVLDSRSQITIHCMTCMEFYSMRRDAVENAITCHEIFDQKCYIGFKYIHTRSWLTKMRWNSIHLFVIDVYGPLAISIIFAGFERSRWDFNITESWTSVICSSSACICRTFWPRLKQSPPRSSEPDATSPVTKKQLIRDKKETTFKEVIPWKYCQKITRNLACIWIRQIIRHVDKNRI